MIVRFTPDAHETIRACAALTARHVDKERMQIILLIVLAVTFLLAYVVVPSHWIVAGFLSYFSTVLAFGAVHLDYRRRTTSMLTNNPHLNESHEIELTPERLITRCSHVASEYAWSGIERVSENAEFYILSSGPASGITVPKRALNDEEDRALREIVRLAARDGGAHLAREIATGALVP